jgi:serine protease Do/serine protease DegQ
MIYSPSGASAGLGFAIPSDLAAKVMKQLIAHGKVERGSLGVDAQDLTPRVAAALGIKATQGALITDVLPGSPAAAAGLKPGDLVTSVNGQPVTDAQDLRNAQGLAPVGSTLVLGVDRNGRSLKLDAKLTAISGEANGASLDARLAGATFSDAGPGGDENGIEGVSVATVDAGSRAARNGLRTGDLVVGINNVATPDLSALRHVFALHPRDLWLTLVRQGQLVQIQMGGR